MCTKTYHDCKQWLRKTYRLKKPLRILLVNHDTIVRHANDKSMKPPMGEKRLSATGYDGMHIWNGERLRILIAKECNAELRIATLLHEFVHVIIAERKLQDTSLHGKVFNRILKRLENKWNKCTSI